MAEGCYRCGKYAECFKLVSWLLQVSSDREVQKKALDLKGKALYYVFTSEKKYLKKNVSRRDFMACYSKAREAINLLGLSIDSGIDEAAQKLLDRVHFTYLRKTRSPDLVRCLLCRKKDKLKASHIWPKSVLKHLLKCMAPLQHQVFSVPWKEYGSLQTANQLTFPMLCGHCEQLLSHSCENKFKVEFFSKLYDPEDCYNKLAKAQSIEYGEYLYRFCLSIIFRALPLDNSDISLKGNAADLFKLFSTCRELLLTENITNFPDKPSIALIVSPTTLPDGVSRVPMIDRILHSAGMLLLCPLSLHDCTKFPGKVCFLIASIGVLNFVVSLDQQTPLLLPPSTMINPNGGIFTFPEDCKRYFSMPLGLWKELEAAAKSYSKGVFYLPQRLVKSHDWAEREFRDLQDLLIGSKRSDSDEVTHLHYLPDNFDTSEVFDLGGSLSVPAGHCILLHMYENKEPWVATIFLVVGADLLPDSNSSSFNPYIVLTLRLSGYIVCVGYYVSHDKAVTTSSLVSSEDMFLLPQIEVKYQTRAIADTLLPKLLQQRGFSSMDALLFWLERV